MDYMTNIFKYSVIEKFDSFNKIVYLQNRISNKFCYNNISVKKKKKKKDNN